MSLPLDEYKVRVEKDLLPAAGKESRGLQSETLLQQRQHRDFIPRAYTYYTLPTVLSSKWISQSMLCLGS
jgi:hypothetical protein